MKKGELLSRLISTLAKWGEVGLQGDKMGSKDEFHKMAALPSLFSVSAEDSN